jgi:hypothetical protein
MERLHRLLHHSQHLLAQLIQVHLIAQCGTEGCCDLGGTILATVETAVYDRLDATAQGLEESCNGQRRGDNPSDLRQKMRKPIPHQIAAMITERMVTRAAYPLAEKPMAESDCSTCVGSDLLRLHVVASTHAFYLRRLRHAGLADQVPPPLLFVVNVPLKVPSGCIEPANDKLLLV